MLNILKFLQLFVSSGRVMSSNLAVALAMQLDKMFYNIDLSYLSHCNVLKVVLSLLRQ